VDIMASLLQRSSPVYLVDLACYKPPEELRVRKDDVVAMGHELKVGCCSREVITACWLVCHSELSWPGRRHAPSEAIA
jgi:hypothetical protein